LKKGPEVIFTKRSSQHYCLQAENMLKSEGGRKEHYPRGSWNVPGKGVIGRPKPGVTEESLSREHPWKITIVP